MMMKKNDFLQLFNEATKAASCANKNDSPDDVSRCVNAMELLKKQAPASLVCDMLFTTDIGKSYKVFEHHQNPKIRTHSRLLWDLWLTYLYASGTKPRAQIPLKRVEISKPRAKKRVTSSCNTTVKKKSKQVTPCKIKTDDSKREKVRDMLHTSLAKVVDEVVDVDTEMKKRVSACDPWLVAKAVESAMFEKLSEEKAKYHYRSILFNIQDSDNPDLRRKVLIGEITAERLVTMTSHELASDKLQMHVKEIQERSKVREDNRIKMMMLTDE